MSSSDKGYVPTPSQGLDDNASPNNEYETVPNRKRTAKVWADFKLTVYKGPNGKREIAKCKHCGVEMNGESSNGTSHLIRHRKSCMQRQVNEGSQQTLSFGLNESGAASPCLQKFDMDQTKKLIAKAVIVHEHSFRFVEEKYTMMAFQSCNVKFNPFSRRTLMREIMSMYNDEKLRLQHFISSCVQRVSLTCDTWTSLQTLGYLCVTGQYIDKDWKLHSHIFNFVHVPPPYTANSLYEVLSECIAAWDIGSKLFSITANNCSTNDSAISALKRSFGARGLIPLKGKHFHVCCGAHIINLMVQDGMSDMKEAISKIRESVKYVKGSPKRFHAFKDCAKAMKLSEVKNLSYDVPTRWKSTFLMLKNALYYKYAFMHLASIDSNYIYLPSEDEWSCASSICEYLKIFYDSTVLLCATKRVTANVIFEEVYTISKHLCEHQMAENEHTRVLACGIQEKYDKYWKDYNVMFAMARILDPRFKLYSVKILLQESDEPNAMDQYEIIEQCFHEMYAEYKHMYGTNDIENASSTQPDEGRGHSNDKSNKFKTLYLTTSSHQLPHTDLEAYLNDPLEEGTNNFDILLWWFQNETKYKILSKMARDVLAIPVSSVASESAFSTAGRVVTDHPCSSTPETIEALICTQSWIRNSEKIPCESSSDEDSFDVKS